MPFCPNCKSEYVEGVETCSDCGEQLIVELPPESQEVEEQYYENWGKIENVGTESEAEMIIEVLKNSEVPAFLKAYPVSAMPGSDLRGVDIMVPQEFFEKAAGIINEIYSKEGLNGIEPMSDQELDSQNDFTQDTSEALKEDTIEEQGTLDNDGLIDENVNNGGGLFIKLLIAIVVIAFVAYLFINGSII